MGQDAADLVRAAEGELTLAALALDTGDHRGAAAHLSKALSRHPSLADAYTVLDELTAAAGDLFPLDEVNAVPPGTVAAQAHLHAVKGDRDNAVILLATAVAACPTLDWGGVPWFTDGALAGRLSPMIWRAVHTVSDGGDDELEGPVYVRFLELARRVIARNGYHHRLLAAGSALARRLGRFQEAIDWATRAERIEPSRDTALVLARAYGAVGQVTDAEAAWLRAISRDAADICLLHDLAEWIGGAGRVDDAIRYAERALALDPDHVHGLTTLHALRYQRDGDVRHLVALASIARAGTDDGFAEQRLEAACDGAPWLNRVPRPIDPTVALLDHLLDGRDTEAPPPVPQTLEAPSAGLVPGGGPDRATGPATDAPPGTGSSRPGADPPAAPGSPGSGAAGVDPRLPRRPVRYQVWHYDGAVAMPAVAPPSEAAAEAVRRLPTRWWPHPPAAYDQGVHLSGLGLDDLLGLLVHPPLPPSGEAGRLLARHEPELWVRLVQAWTCLGIAHYRADQPWWTSIRREVLADLAYGPEDWVSEAALFALVATAWVVPRVRVDVASLVAERIADTASVVRHREMPIATSLATIALATPGLSESATRTAQWVLAGAAGQLGALLAATTLEPRWRRMFRRD